MRTIELELLRPGPPEGQLLSPLTQYIAVCDAHPPELLQLGFDQRTVLDRLARLRYDEGNAAGEADLREAAELARSVLGGIKGFNRALHENSHDGKLVHVRLVLNASELAMIPFELAYAPLAQGGLPGVSTSGNTRVVLTRETRHDRVAPTGWDQRPRVLFVTAAPGGSDVPAAAHLAALERAFRRILPTPARGGAGAEAHPFITVLHRATLDDLQAACERQRFSWVHILAHGAPLGSRDGRFGLLLHSEKSVDGEVVQGDQLASALRQYRKGGASLGPAVVSLAICDGGNVGDLTYSEASLAHRLHEKEVPLVIASQFPLTFEGSVVMADALYDGLVRGLDPRELVGDVRRALYRKVRNTHDWAAVVAYARLPQDFDLDALAVQIEADSRALDALMAEVEGRGLEHGLPVGAPPQASELAAFERLLEEARSMLSRIEAAERDEATPRSQRDGMKRLKLWVRGRLANGYKRFAALYRGSLAPGGEGATSERNWLRQSFEQYLELARMADAPAWAQVQALTTWAACLRLGAEPPKPDGQKGRFDDLWLLAWENARFRQSFVEDALERLDLCAQHLQLALVASTSDFGPELSARGQHELPGAFGVYQEAAKAARAGQASGALRFQLFLHGREFGRIMYWWWPEFFRADRQGQPEVVRAFVSNYEPWLNGLGVALNTYMRDPRY